MLGTHGALAHRLGWAAVEWPVRPGDTRLVKSSVSFIDGLTELLAAVAGGARVVPADDATAGDPAALAERVAGSGTAQLTAVPSLVAALAAAGAAGPELLTRLVCSGEPLTAQVVAAARRWAPAPRSSTPTAPPRSPATSWPAPSTRRRRVGHRGTTRPGHDRPAAGPVPRAGARRCRR